MPVSLPLLHLLFKARHSGSWNTFVHGNGEADDTKHVMIRLSIYRHKLDLVRAAERRLRREAAVLQSMFHQLHCLSWAELSLYIDQS